MQNYPRIGEKMCAKVSVINAFAINNRRCFVYSTNVIINQSTSPEQNIRYERRPCIAARIHLNNKIYYIDLVRTSVK